MFLEVSLIINVLFPFWLEPYLISFDNLLFGHHPTVWVQDLFNRSLTEYMAFSYWSYYILLPLTGFVLFVQKDKSLFRSFVFNLSLTLYICYFSYLFLTARGPHETLAHLHLEREVAGFFDNWVKTIQENAAISGAAFPSSHVTAVWISWIYLFRFRKWLGFVVLPLVLSLSFSVVYMQYHYAIDPIAGIVLICLSYPLGRKLEKNQKRRRAEVK
ncbi:MAG: phosphatase PAP2 family protein [Desulfobacterales bacterium]